MNRLTPDLTIVIPFYNRADTLGFTLGSVDRARAGLNLEVLLVDDGSEPPAESQLHDWPLRPDRILRQENRGLLFARLAGLDAARGRHVLFLDSDDLIGPEKLRLQLAAMGRHGVPVSYTDTAQAELREPGTTIAPRADAAVATTTDGPTCFIQVQPAPHSPIFSTDWLRQRLNPPLFPPRPLYNSVAEIWFYHVLAARPFRVCKVPGPHTIIGHHGGERITGRWERLAVASLGVMEAFSRSCRDQPETLRARQLVGQRAFESWRRLPYDFFPEFQQRMLAVWRRLPRGPLRELGGPLFRSLAAVTGPVGAARFLRRLRGAPYQHSQTLPETGLFQSWMSELPPA